MSYYLHSILESVGIEEPSNQSLFNGGSKYGLSRSQSASRRILWKDSADGTCSLLQPWEC